MSLSKSVSRQLPWNKPIKAKGGKSAVVDPEKLSWATYQPYLEQVRPDGVPFDANVWYDLVDAYVDGRINPQLFRLGRPEVKLSWLPEVTTKLVYGRPVYTPTGEDYVSAEGYKVLCIETGPVDKPSGAHDGIVRTVEDNAIHAPEKTNLLSQLMILEGLVQENPVSEALARNVARRTVFTIDPFGASSAGAKAAIDLDTGKMYHNPPVAFWNSDERSMNYRDPNGMWDTNVSPVHNAVKAWHDPANHNGFRPDLAIGRHETVGGAGAKAVWGNAGVMLIEHWPIDQGTFAQVLGGSKFPGERYGQILRVIYGAWDALPLASKITPWEKIRQSDLDAYANFGAAAEVAVKESGHSFLDYGYSQYLRDSRLLPIGYGRELIPPSWTKSAWTFCDWASQAHGVPGLTPETFPKGRYDDAGGIEIRAAEQAYLTFGALQYALESKGVLPPDISDRLWKYTDSVGGKFNDAMLRAGEAIRRKRK